MQHASISYFRSTVVRRRISNWHTSSASDLKTFLRSFNYLKSEKQSAFSTEV